LIDSIISKIFLSFNNKIIISSYNVTFKNYKR